MEEGRQRLFIEEFEAQNRFHQGRAVLRTVVPGGVNLVGRQEPGAQHHGADQAQPRRMVHCWAVRVNIVAWETEVPRWTRGRGVSRGEIAVGPRERGGPIRCRPCVCYRSPMIDFDRNATTPLAPAVVAAMREHLADPAVQGNPSSLHRRGQRSRAAIEHAREAIAGALRVEPLQVVFTSGGTEADNLAILGSTRALRRTGRPHGILTSPLEHPAVVAAAERARWEGSGLARVPVDPQGCIDPARVRQAVADGPEIGLVSLAAANHELGNAYDVPALVQAIRDVRPQVVVHCDAVQALGKIAVDFEGWGVDLMSVSAHKIGGPKGVGALVVRPGTALDATTYGGGQERGLRPGTESPLLACGLAAALTGLEERRIGTQEHVRGLREQLRQGLVAIDGTEIHGDPQRHVGNTVLASFGGCEGPLLVMALDLEGVAVSSGAACSSGTTEPSPVLLALGVPPWRARSAVRFSLGPDHQAGDVERVLEALHRVVPRVRAASAPPMVERRVAT